MRVLAVQPLRVAVRYLSFVVSRSSADIHHISNPISIQASACRFYAGGPGQYIKQ
jgi:hypothetical protein